ncbi:MAG: type I-E CRISPR-associated protein Cse1/CasA [Proteobacteria bacterium]|nr:type I-E CRISPR-associated protein Cse1/CasA [Pseudomonadota bacterium]
MNALPEANAMDIFRDAWIPTDKGILSPADALNQASRAAWPRGDWNAATLMLLHAMVQTAVVTNDKCPDRDTWLDLMESPPKNLHEWFDGLDAGPMAWQCLTAEGDVPVAAILPETPGDNALRNTSDIMHWQQDAPTSLTVHEAQIAIISDNFCGMPIGSGHRIGCRGYSPMTTMVEPENLDATLWDRVWLNVFPKQRWDDRYRSRTPFIFPWQKELPTGEVTPDNAHSLEMLWQMPRRWRMIIGTNGMVSTLMRQGDGRNYVGWEHPLTGLFLTTAKQWLGTKINPHIGFREWAAIAVGLKEQARQPAVVARYIQDRLWRGKPIRLRCFGWTLVGKSIGTWVDLVVPFYVDVDHAQLEQAIATAETVRANLAGRLKGVSKHLANDAIRLYQAMEPEFYRRVAATDWDGWEIALRRQAREIFWEIAALHRHDMYATAKAVATL